MKRSTPTWTGSPDIVVAVGQPSLFQASEELEPTAVLRRKGLFREQVELGAPVEQARADVDKAVLRPSGNRQRAVPVKRGRKASGSESVQLWSRATKFALPSSVANLSS